MPKYKRRVMAWGWLNKRGKLLPCAVDTKEQAVVWGKDADRVVEVWIERVDKRRRG